ncbi:MAG TPA: molybdenum ABC transporter ATP-binding protein [Rhizomicrobium sp.]|nr:molybdenum ABC transporter ATP-binding protein [Rhizomicrobium sp.]
MTIDIRLHHRFGSFVIDAAFAIDKPGITALFGPSGAGKSTVANAVAGLFRPAEGRIVLGDRIVFDSKERIFLPPRARRVGYVFQDSRLFPHMSVENNLRFGWRRAEPRADANEFARIVDMLGLESLLARKPAKLSGGEKSRVALGRALLSSPDLLILDEPLAALDAARKAEILPWLERLRDAARLPMIFVTHALDEVARLADQVVLLRKGRVEARGAAFDLLPDLEFASLAGTTPLGAVLPAKVAVHRDDGLTELAFDGGALFVPQLDAEAGTPLRVRLRAEDVMLARVIPGAISANNVLSTTVVAARVADESHADVQLLCGFTKIVSRITRASYQRLEIKPGMPIFAIVKSVIVDSR